MSGKVLTKLEVQGCVGVGVVTADMNQTIKTSLSSL